MSGPALKQLAAHHSIHEAAGNEAEELTQILRQTVADGDESKISEVAYVLLEHWETRTLRHAASEEEGFYLEVLQMHPEVEQDIIRLKRDHELMKILVSEIKSMLKQVGFTAGILERFEALILINVLHGREEESRILTLDLGPIKAKAETML